MNTPVSRLAIVGALVVLVLFGLAAILFVADGTAATERLGLFFALIGTVVAGLLASLRADQAANQTNGSLDGRVKDAVSAALAERRSTDK
jgi:hypothetical protein